MAVKKAKIAIMYDFDKTLCTKDMQEYGFIPRLGIKNIDFWKEAGALAREQKLDSILAYMYLMLRKAKEKDVAITRKDFVDLGRGVEFFPGVEKWFQRINKYGKEHGAQVEHYIISSGLKEIIEGSKISKNFKQIYACEFHYDANSVADWPKNAVNYTTKTQFLFRINKGVLDISNDKDLNAYVHKDERVVPFRNMIYIGDGLTDVPCMKLVKANGGQSIAVYQNRKKEKVKDLLVDKRVQYIVPASYEEDKELDKIVKAIIQKMIVEDGLVTIHRKQIKGVGDKS